jgi:LysM repeat protein
MSTPNPLIPQGTFQAAAGKGASNVRIAVATIVAIHVVFFGGLLLQGCKRDNTLALKSDAETNAATSTNYTLPPINSDSLYSNSTTRLAADSTTNLPAPPSGPMSDTLGSSTTSRDPWRSSNLGTPGMAAGAQDQTTGATKEYVVASGDTYKKIAMANGTTVAALKKANPNVDPAKLRPKTKLVIPVAASASAPASISTGGLSGDNGGVGAAGETYTVKAGDTLTKIARAHHVTTSELRAANNLKTADIRPNQKLKIPAPSSTGTNAPAAVKHAKIKSSTNTTNTAAH